MRLPISKKYISIFSSVAVAVLLYFINPFEVNILANKVLSVAALIILLWVTEALPMAVVALLPLVLFPLLGINTIEVTAASYSNPVIFLFMGGFMLGLAIEKWNLHRRIALNIVRLTGTSGNKIILGFILATGLLSMWLSNTATTMMMFPIALSVIQVIKKDDTKGSANFALSIMLSIALASNFGGIATLIGTPPNVAYAAFVSKKYNYSIDFFDWMLVCLPLSLLLLGCLYLVLTKWLYPNGMKTNAATGEIIQNEINLLGPFSAPEKRVLVIFLSTAFLWITKDLINGLQLFKLDDNMIALMGGIALFATPSGKRGEGLLVWSDTQKMAWGILLLFGGGIALASALEKAGVIENLGQWFTQFAFHTLLLIFLVAFISLFVSEVMSNVAQVIVFAPVVSSLADAAHLHPLMLGIPMALAASCASMLPMGTPPNAIAFSSGYIKLKDMTRVGFVMNVIAVILITLFCWLVLPLVLK